MYIVNRLKSRTYPPPPFCIYRFLFPVPSSNRQSGGGGGVSIEGSLYIISYKLINILSPPYR